MVRYCLRVQDFASGCTVDVRQAVDYRDRRANWRCSPSEAMRLARREAAEVSRARAAARDAHPRRRFP